MIISDETAILLVFKTEMHQKLHEIKIVIFGPLMLWVSWPTNYLELLHILHTWGIQFGYTQYDFDFRLKSDIEYDVSRFLIMLPVVIWYRCFQTFPSKNTSAQTTSYFDSIVIFSYPVVYRLCGIQYTGRIQRLPKYSFEMINQFLVLELLRWHL